jgi:Domain of unknown function (DUF4178)
MEYSCPNCGAPLKFMSRVSIYTTCTYCRSTVVRHDMNLKTLGKVAELLNDMSPFQVGTSGRYEGKGFTLLGRVKVLYDKGMWSEWWAAFDDGSEGWLAEAQGFYMMSKAVDPGPLQHPDDLKSVGKELSIEGLTYRIDDVKQIRYAGSEGELPYVYYPDKKGVSVDLRAPGGRFASILFGMGDAQLFVGHYLPFTEFQFTNLRVLDGWTAE